MNNRLLFALAWLVGIVFSTIITLWPYTIRFGNSPTPVLVAIGGFPSLSLFLASWVALALSVVFLLLKGRSRSEVLAAVIMFCMAFEGTWIAALGGLYGEISPNAILTSYALSTGHLPGYITGLGGSEFPGLPILSTVVSGFVSIGSLASLWIAETIFVVVIPLFMFLCFSSLLDDYHSAGLAAVLFSMGNILLPEIAYEFHPRAMGFAFLALFAWQLVRRRERTKFSSTIVVVLVFLAIVMTHLVDVMVLLPILIVSSIVNRSTRSTFPPYLLLGFIGITLAWMVFQATSTSQTLLQSLTGAFSQEFALGFSYLFSIAQANFGPTLPVWVTLIRLSWIVFLMGCGSLLVVVQFVRKQKTPLWSFSSSGVLGLAIFGAFVVVLSLQEAERLIYYVPVVTTPAIAYYLGKTKSSLHLSTVAIVLLLSFPTFVVDNPGISISANYSYTNSSARFLASHLSSSTVYGTQADSYFVFYYDTTVDFAQLYLLTYVAQSAAAAEAAELATLKQVSQMRGPVFIDSYYWLQPIQWFFPSTNHTGFWSNFQAIASAHNLIYDNGYQEQLSM